MRKFISTFNKTLSRCLLIQHPSIITWSLVSLQFLALLFTWLATFLRLAHTKGIHPFSLRYGEKEGERITCS